MRRLKIPRIIVGTTLWSTKDLSKIGVSPAKGCLQYSVEFMCFFVKARSYSILPRILFPDEKNNALYFGLRVEPGHISKEDASPSVTIIESCLFRLLVFHRNGIEQERELLI